MPFKSNFFLYEAGTDRFAYFLEYKVNGSVWRCDMCKTTTNDPAASLTCNCSGIFCGSYVKEDRGGGRRRGKRRGRGERE